MNSVVIVPDGLTARFLQGTIENFEDVHVHIQPDIKSARPLALKYWLKGCEVLVLYHTMNTVQSVVQEQHEALTCYARHHTGSHRNQMVFQPIVPHVTYFLFKYPSTTDHFCIQNGRPPLTVLQVYTGTLIPLDILHKMQLDPSEILDQMRPQDWDLLKTDPDIQKWGEFYKKLT